MTDNELKALLERHIQEFVDSVCEDLDMWWGLETVKHMTDAAFAVFAGAREAVRHYEAEVTEGQEK